jgi:hypothetical protein
VGHVGLVHGRQEGRGGRYAADFDGVRGVANDLRENCCGGDAALSAPQTITASEEEIW